MIPGALCVPSPIKNGSWGLGINVLHEICLPEIVPKILKNLEIISKIGPKSSENHSKSGRRPDFEPFWDQFRADVVHDFKIFQIFLDDFQQTNFMRDVHSQKITEM